MTERGNLGVESYEKSEEKIAVNPDNGLLTIYSEGKPAITITQKLEAEINEYQTRYRLLHQDREISPIDAYNQMRRLATEEDKKERSRVI